MLCNEQLVRCVLEQSEVGTVPVRAVLFWRERICNEGGKLDGRGGWRLLLDRRSWVRAEKDEIVEGMVPLREVDDRSRSLRDAWNAELEDRDDRGLLSFWELTTLERG